MLTDAHRLAVVRELWAYWAQSGCIKLHTALGRYELEVKGRCEAQAGGALHEVEAQAAELMTIVDVAKFMQLSIADISILTMRHGLPCVPGCLRFSKAAVMQWFRERSVTVHPAPSFPQTVSWISAPDIIPMRPPEGGGVYAIGASSGHVKIGKSRNFRHRFGSIQGANPFPLMFLAVLSPNEADESDLHKAFSAHCIRGEWFAPHQEIIAAIREARGAA